MVGVEDVLVHLEPVVEAKSGTVWPAQHCVHFLRVVVARIGVGPQRIHV